MANCAAIGTIGLKRVTLNNLEPDLNNIMIIAIIIGKQSPRKFLDKTKDNEQYRAVWNFTLRDSQRDYINVSYWGPSELVLAASDKFYTGDVVEIRNPRINVRKFNEISEQYCPMVTSPFTLILNEHSQILPFYGDIFIFTKLLNFPTKPLSAYIPLRDIHNRGENMKDRFVDILGAVRSVGPLKTVKAKTGRELQMREIILFDHTSPSLKVSLWDIEIILKAANWKPRSTILFITDVRIVWSSFLNVYSASVTGRSIITENPIGVEATNLSDYAKDAPLDTTDILNQFIITLPNPESIQNVMCIQQVRSKINDICQRALTSEPQILSLLYVIVTKLDLDGPQPVLQRKCGSCKSLLSNSASRHCENSECPTVLGQCSRSVTDNFDIRVNLSDHTGTLTNCRLSGSIAEHVLNCTIHQFLRLSNEEKSRLKWKYLMERCAVRIVVLITNANFPRISIVSCSKANPLEVIQKLPLC